MPDLVPRDDLTIVQGDDRPLVWTLTDVTGNPIDVTNYDALAQVRPRHSSPTVLHEWSTTAGNAVLADSTVTLRVNDSEDWTWSHGVYDLHITDGLGRTEVVARGSVVVTPGVTRT